MTVQAEHVNADIATQALTVAAERGGVEIIDRLADEWRTLCRESTQDRPFYRPEWIGALIRAFFPDAKVLLITVRHERRLCLVLPLLEETGFLAGVPVRKLRAPVNGHSCWFDATRSPGELGEAAISALWHYFRKLRSWDVLELREIPGDGGLPALALAAEASRAAVKRVDQHPTPIIVVPHNPELLKQLPRNARLRGKLRHIRRELSAIGELHLSRVEGAEPSALERVYKIEADGWKGEEGSAIACDPKTRQFYDEIAQSAARFGYLSLYLLELNEDLLAAHFGLSLGGHYFSPKVAHDENKRDWAPGHLIVSEILQDCCSRGISDYDITGADHEWKMKWTDKTRDKHAFYIFHKGVRSRLAFLLRFRLRPWLVRVIRRSRPAA